MMNLLFYASCLFIRFSGAAVVFKEKLKAGGKPVQQGGEIVSMKYGEHYPYLKLMMSYNLFLTRRIVFKADENISISNTSNHRVGHNLDDVVRHK